MKKHIIYKTLNVLLFLCISFNVMAQRDLVFTSAIAPVTTVSPSQQFSITYTLTNSAASTVSFGDGIDLDVAYNPDMATTDFSYVTFSTTDTAWMGCVEQPVSIPTVALTFGVNCLYQGVLAVGASTSITIDYIVANSTVANNYNFEALATDVGISETDFTNNRATTLMTVAGVADYQLQVLSPNPLAIDTTPGTDPISFQLDLLGANGMSSFEIVDISVPAGFTLANVTMVNGVGFTGIATWACVINTAPNWQCFNTATTGGMNAGDSAIISADIINRPGTPGGPHLFVADIFDSISPAGNTATLNVNVNNPPSGGNLIIDNSGANPNPSTPASITFNHAITLPQQIHYRLKNTGTMISNGVGTTIEFKLTFDDTRFFISNSIISGTGAWTCSPATAGVLSCITNDSTYGAGAFTDFSFDVSTLVNTSAATYTNALQTFATITTNPTVNVFNTDFVVINPDITINKTLTLVNGSAPVGAPVNVQNGDTVTYKILAVNNTANSSAANNIVFTDTLPVGLINPSIVSDLGNFNGNCSFAGLALSCSNASSGLLPHDPTGTVEDGVIITADVSGAVGNTIQNQVKLTSVQFDSTANSLVNANKSLLINAPVGGAISITKVANQSSYTIGDDVIYTITIENTSPTFSVSDLEISDLLPGNYLDLNPANVSVLANTLIGTSVFTCAFGTVIDTASCDNIASTDPFNPGDRVEVVITATANAIGTAIANTANYLSLQSSLNGSSAPALIDITQAVSSIGPTSITVEKNVLQNGVLVSEITRGSSFQYEVIVSNTGNFAVNNLSLIDTMPLGVVVDNITTPSGMSCNNQGQIYNCNYTQNIPINSSIQVIYDVTDFSDNNTLTLLNTVRAISINAQEKTAEVLVNLTGSNPNPSPNPNAQYTLEIKDDVDPVLQGDNYNYIVTVTNTGSVVINSLDINVLIPQDLDVNSTNTNGTTCSIISTGVHCIASGGLSINPGEQLDIVFINVVSTSFVGDVLVEVQANTTSTTTISDNETTTILENISNQKTDLSVAVLNTQVVTQGGQTSFDVSIDNLGFPALKPRISIGLSGLIDTIQVSENEFWGCDIAGLNVNCQYKGTSMPSGPSSNIHFNLDLSRISTQVENIVVMVTAESDTEDDFIGNNTATATISVNPTPSEGEILSALQSALNGKGNQQTNKAIENVASYCEVSYFKALEGLCSKLYETALSGDGETINTVMEQITPNEVIGQSTSIAEIATAQFRNIGSRLSQLRTGGGSGFSSAGLNATYGNGSLPLGMLAYLNKSADESSGIDVKNDFISPWGFFVNGTISMGSRDATGRELGFDFDSYGLTAGVDYRVSASKVVGVALGYANFDSDVDGQAKLKSTGLTLTGYGSFYVNDNFYVDARISVAKPDFDQSRKIDFTLGDTTISRVADGSTSSNQYSVAMSAGYNFYKNSWNITPNGSFRYIKTSIDGFTETGAGGFNFIYSDQDLESMIWSAGIKVSKAISLKNGVITPQFDFDYNYESLNDGNDIEARFVTAPLGEVFIIETDSPDRTYGSAGLGFAYISSNGKQAYINYRSVLGLEGFSRGTFNLGARFEF